MKKPIFVLAVTVCTLLLLLSSGVKAAEPKGAKALFDSGEGSAVRMSSGPKTAPTAVAEAPKQEKYVGIAYKLALIKPNGDFTIVPKSHVFRTGDRVKLLVRSNRSGYLTILNIGSSGNTHVLFNDYVEARTIHEIPRDSNFRFVGQPGTEKVLIMLSGNPNPFGGQTAQVASAPSTTSSATSCRSPRAPTTT